MVCHYIKLDFSRRNKAALIADTFTPSTSKRNIDNACALPALKNRHRV